MIMVLWRSKEEEDEDDYVVVVVWVERLMRSLCDGDTGVRGGGEVCFMGVVCVCTGGGN